MSFADFDKGITADDMRKKQMAERAEVIARDQLYRLKESERILDILRPIKASRNLLGKEEVKRWLEVIGQRKN